MTDPASFGTMLWTVVIGGASVIALGLAVLADMALRRREDRAHESDARHTASPSANGQAPHRS